MKKRNISLPLENIIIKIKNKLTIDVEADLESFRDKCGESLAVFTDDKHLKETSNWLVRAWEAGDDGGVARAYRAVDIKRHSIKGWQPSYPETTGYIIPTMFALADYLSLNDYRRYALKMADWEIEIQMSSGAVMGSVVTAKPSPAVFNTGQVIFGWLVAFKQSGDQKYLDAAYRAGNYLIDVQGDEGSWQKGDSNFALKGATTYNARGAWALIELGLVSGIQKYIDSGKKNIEQAISKQNAKGWFADNCLNEPDNPLLHTIVYATRGVLESGVCLGESRYIDSALKTLNALIACQRPDGGIPGRLKSDWSSKENWDCVTGDAQAAIAWLRANEITGEKKYMDAARNAIEFIKKTQNLSHPNPGIKGGVKGSFPFDGPYGQYQMLNWAAKFFCDALMLINVPALRKKGIDG